MLHRKNWLRFVRREHAMALSLGDAYLDGSSFRVATCICMRVVGLKVLKNKLSEYVRLAARGEAVLITDRDTVVAEIVGPRLGRSPMLPRLLAEAVRGGWITPPAFSSEEPMPRKPVMSSRELMREIEADREER